MADETFRILKQRSMASVWIEDQPGVFQMLEHEIRVAVGHRIVAAAHDQHRLVDAPQDFVVGVLGSAPAGHGFGLLAHDRFPALRIAVHRSGARSLQKGQPRRLLPRMGKTGEAESRAPPALPDNSTVAFSASYKQVGRR